MPGQTSTGRTWYSTTRALVDGRHQKYVMWSVPPPAGSGMVKVQGCRPILTLVMALRRPTAGIWLCRYRRMTSQIFMPTHASMLHKKGLLTRW